MESCEESAARLLEEIRALIAETRSHKHLLPEVTLDTSLDKDIGLDSLTRLELLSRIEARFNVTLTDERVLEADTPREILRAFRDDQPFSDFQAVSRIASPTRVPALPCPPETAWPLTNVRIGQWAYAIRAWCCFGVMLPFILGGVWLIPGNRRRWYYLHHLARFLRAILFVPMQVKGIDNLPADNGVVLIANHASYLDIFILMAALPSPFRFVAKAELTRHWWIRRSLLRIKTVFVERFNRRQSIRDAFKLADLAREGTPLLFFPEGTIIRKPGLLPFRLGAFQTAVSAGLPIVPVVIKGSRSMLREGSWFPRKGEVQVIIGKPIEDRERSEEGDAGRKSNQWSAGLRLLSESRKFILSHCGEPDLEMEESSLVGGEGEVRFWGHRVLKRKKPVFDDVKKPASFIYKSGK